jgi:hypothetical protein
VIEFIFLQWIRVIMVRLMIVRSMMVCVMIDSFNNDPLDDN